jgi:hypothetical protein
MPENQGEHNKPPIISKAMLDAASPEFKQVVEAHLALPHEKLNY